MLKLKNKTLKLKAVKRNNLILIALFFLAGLSTTFGQCYIKSTDQSAGYITYYLDSETIAENSDAGITLSVQMVGNNYYLALSYRFINKAEPLEEKVALELQNGYTLELDMYTMQVGNSNGMELVLAVYNLNPDLFNYFTSSDLKAVRFKTQTGTSFDVPVTKNHNALKRQLKCFGK